MSDLDVHGAAGRDHLQILGAHCASAAASSVGVLDARHDVGIPYQVFAGGTADSALDIGVAQLFSYGPLGLCYGFSPQILWRLLSLLRHHEPKM